jgi:hypothetical protein
MCGIDVRGAAAVKRHFDNRRREVGIQLARFAVGPARGAGQGITLAQGVEDLPADPSRGVRGEPRAGVVAIPARGLDESDDAPGEEILTVRATATRVESTRRDRPRESKVRDDAFVARLNVHFFSSLLGGTVSMGGFPVNNAVTDLSTIAERYFDRYGYPVWLRTHSRVVATIATRLAEAHVASGAELNVAVVALGGYLHDIGKSPLLAGDSRAHNLLGPLVLAAEGLPELAELSRRHPVYGPRDQATAPRTLAEKIVYYADRRGGQRVVTLEERIDEQVARFPELAQRRAADLAMAKAIEADVLTGIALGPQDLT